MKFLLSLFVLTSLGFTDHSIQLTQTQTQTQTQTHPSLSPCPNSPNCVSTQEPRKRKQMDPMVFEGSATQALEKLRALIATYPNATLVEEEGYYLHYEFETNIGKFIDDVEFVVDEETQLIHFRSASRTGYGDMGKNKRRMKKIKKQWEEG